MPLMTLRKKCVLLADAFLSINALSYYTLQRIQLHTPHLWLQMKTLEGREEN